ncbi:Fc.00g017690.m01.CDS01 [Cosmosporella sp. VM-42]
MGKDRGSSTLLAIESRAYDPAMYNQAVGPHLEGRTAQRISEADGNLKFHDRMSQLS